MFGIQIAKNGGVEVMEYLSTLAKPVPSNGQVLVKNAFAGVNYIDTYHRSGLYPVKFPLILGREGSGIVDEVGPGVTKFKKGDRVAYFAQGSYAEYTAAPVSTTALLPNSCKFEDGSIAIVSGLTALMLSRKVYSVESNDVVLVHAAAGGIGQLLCQICKHHGAKVIGTTSTAEKAKVAKEAGADHVILYTEQNVQEEVNIITSGQGVSVVFDGVGKTTFDISLSCLRRRGWLICFGNASGKPEPFDILRLTKQGSVTLCRPTLFDYIDTEERFTQMMEELMQNYVSKNVIKFDITEILPLSEARKAHEKLEGRQTTGKIVLKI